MPPPPTVREGAEAVKEGARRCSEHMIWPLMSASELAAFKGERRLLSDEEQIAAARFKEQCLSILDHVAEEGLVKTKHGRPVAKLLPIRAESSVLMGSLKGKVRIKGDVLATGVKWRAQS